MTCFEEFLGGDHKVCDDLFARAEQAVGGEDWERAATAGHAFLAAMEHHFTMEEAVLFPAFEAASGASMGPTEVMRHEHTQMRQLLGTMLKALTAQDGEEYLGSGETLLILMQQHNAKEEQILYPMADGLLAGQRDALLARMNAIGAEAG